MNKYIIIPAYNPSKILYELLKDIKSESNIFILIIDDGSLNPINFDMNDIKIIRNKKNQGKGAALKRGFKWGLENDFKYAITIDSDGQHPVSKLNEFIDVEDSYDFVFGKRTFSNDMPLHRRISNYLTSLLVSLRINNKIYDSQCGYRRYNILKIKPKNYLENRFMFETEILLKLINKKTKIKHISIPTIYNNEPSNINNILTTYNFIKLYFRSIFYEKSF